MNEVALLMVAVFLIASAGAWLYVLGRWLWGQPWVPYVARRVVPWNPLDLIASMAAFLLLQSLGGSLVRRLWMVAPNASFESLPADAQAAILLAGALATLVTMSLCLLAVAWRTGASALDLGWDSRFFWSDLRLGGVAFLVLAPPVYGVHLALIYGLNLESQHPLVKLLEDGSHPGYWFVTGFAAVLVAPLGEEFFFRLLLQGWLEKAAAVAQRGGSFESLLSGERDPGGEESGDRLPEPDTGETDGGPAVSPVGDDLSAERAGRRPSVIPIFLSALLFAQMHLPRPDPLPLFVLALGLGYLYRQTHRILPCIVVHFLLNACSLLVYGWNILTV